MKVFLLFLLPFLAHAAPAELNCEPDARITFHDRWLRGSVVRIEIGINLELPWTGREAHTSGRQLRSERVRDFDTTEAAANDELLNVVPEETRFLTYREPDSPALYVDNALLEQGEHDGLVILKDGPKTKVLHCRSR